jgi:transketolase
MRKTCLDCVYELAKEDDRIVFIGSDLGAGTLDRFKREMPDRFFMEGISEAHLVGMAAGMALEGRIVYMNTIATFMTRRCYEQIALDLCLHRAQVRLIGSGGGLVYAPLGPTHQAIEDISLLRALPGMTLFAPADAAEMRRMMPRTVDLPGPAYIRLGKGGDPVITPDQPFVVGRAYPLKTGTDALIVTTGITGAMALEAAALLDAQGIATGVLHLPTLKPVDTEALLAQLAPVPVVVSLEEHTRIGGLGTILAELLAEAPFPVPKRFKRIGLPDAFADQYGSQATLMAHMGLSAEAVVDAVRGLRAR